MTQSDVKTIQPRVIKAIQLGRALAACSALGTAIMPGEFKLRIARIAAACRHELDAVAVAERQLLEDHAEKDSDGRYSLMVVNGQRIEGTVKMKNRHAYDEALREIADADCTVTAPTIAASELRRLADFGGEIEGILPFITED